nr:ribonuclease H-like domain, reverse transcriptase, RNA-dependent DNA polymerase [Tanacetum cinerariifolium]
MLKKFDMESVRTATIPYEVPKPKSKDEPDDAVNVHLYRSMIGSLMCLTASRPDIMFVVSACSRHQLEAYSDSDYDGSHGDRKSTTGGCQFLGRRLISWQCKKQIVVATSSTEPEYVAAASCCGQSTICIVKNPVFHQRTKHIEIRHHFIRDAKEKNLIQSTLGCSIPRMTAVSCGFLLYAVQSVGMPLILLVVLVFLLVVLVYADGWVSTSRCTIPTGSCTIPTGSCTISTGSCTIPTSSGTIPTGRGTIPTDSYTLHTGSYSFMLTYNFSTFILDGMIGNIGSKRHKFLMYPRFLQMILGIQTTDPSLRPTFDFMAKLFSNMKLNWDGPPMPLLAPMLVVPAGGDGADAAATGAAAANEVSPPPPPPHVPPTHTSSSTLGPSLAVQNTQVREPTPLMEPTPSPVREPTPFWEPTPDSPRPPSSPPYPRSKEVGPTTSTRPPSPTRQNSFQEDVSEGGGDYVSSPKSNEAPATTAATVAGGAEDSAALTALSLKLARCINRVTSLENELGVTKKVLGGVVLKLVTRVKRLEGLLQQRKRRLVLSDSEGEEATTKEQDIDLDSLHKLASTSQGGDTTVKAAYTIYKASQDAHASSDARHNEDEVPVDTTMPFRRTRTTRRRLMKTVTSSTFEHIQEYIFADEDTIPADAQTILAGSTPIPSSGGVSAGSSMDPADQAATATPLSTISVADKGKAPMVNDSFPADLLSKQERLLKNLHDYQLREDLAKKLHAEQEAEFARQQKELAQKAQAESVASPTEQGTGLPAQRRRELDAAQLIYTEADWLELMAKIATNTAISKQLLGDDVNEDNMNEWLGMILMRKRRELAEQSRVKPMNKTHQRDFMRDFVKNQSASVYNQGWTMKQVKALSIAQLKHEFEYIQRTLERSNLLNFKRTTFRPMLTLEAPSAKRARQEVPQDVHAASSQVPTSVHAAPFTVVVVSVPAAPSIAADVLVSAAPSIPADTEVHADESCLDDTQTASEHVSTKHTVDESTPSTSRIRQGHTKHFTSLHELLHMVEKNDLRRLLGAVDILYQREEPDTFSLILWGDLCMLFQSLADEDAHDFWRNQDSWRIRSWRLYPRAQVHVLKTVDGRVIYMFVDVSYPLSAATLKRMLKHGLEVPKLLVGGDLTMAEHLVSFIKAALLNVQSAV